MAKFGSAFAGWTPVAHADGASSLADSSYSAVRTTTASTIQICEVSVSGEATSSTVNRMALRRLSTNATTPTDVVPAKFNPLSAAAVTQGYRVATTGPTIASTDHLLHVGINAFGGIYRWVAAPGEEIWATAQTAPSGQIVLDSVAGTGVVSTHIIFEEL